jgi:5-methyltetrahydropteroyltriglutamate--homocysteine methyltransferase
MTLKHIRVDNVGSMLRPQSLRDAFIKHAQGTLSDEQLRHEEDEAIRALIRRQEAIGFPIVVDGEFRRAAYMASFAEIEGAEDWLSGLSKTGLPRGAARQQAVAAGPGRGEDPMHTDDLRNPARVRLRLKRSRPLAEYEFTQSQTDTPAKVTIIGPDRVSTLHNVTHEDDVYDDADEFMADVVAVEREMITQLVESGCKYVHIDEPGFTAYADEASLAVLRRRGEDPQRNLERSVDANNALIEGFPDDVTFGVHLCRGNRESLWHREGSYDAIAERVFGGLRYDRLMLEYDTERAGGLEPLRFVRDDAVVVLGLLTTKSGELEDADAVKRRIEEASVYVPVERLALSTQCGFASSITGNLLTEDDQWRKLELIVQIAQDVWGGTR